MKNKKTIDIHQKIFKHFKGLTSSTLVDDLKIEVNFKNCNFSLNKEDFIFLNSFGYKIDSIHYNNNKKCVTIVLNKINIQIKKG